MVRRGGAIPGHHGLPIFLANFLLGFKKLTTALHEAYPYSVLMPKRNVEVESCLVNRTHMSDTSEWKVQRLFAGLGTTQGGMDLSSSTTPEEAKEAMGGFWWVAVWLQWKVATRW